MIVRLVVWVVYRLGPRTLLSLTLLLVALGSVALGLADTVRGLDPGLLLTVAGLGMLVGWGLAKSPLPGWLGGLIALGLGVEIIFLRVGRLGGSLVTLLQALIGGSIKLVVFLVWEFWYPGRTGWPLDDLPGATPILLALGELWAGISTLLVRLRDWSLALATGQPTFDPVATALVWSLVLWAVVAWAGWSVRRRDQPLPGVAPAGVLLSGSLFYVRGNPGFLLPLLGATLLLVALIGQDARERRWGATGVDFPLDVGREVVMGGAALSLVLVMATMLMPSVSVRQVAEWVGRLIGGQPSETQPVAGSLGLDPRASVSATFFDQDQVRAPGLPRRHLLGSGPELSEQVVMVIYPGGYRYPEEEGDTGDEVVPGPPEESAPCYYWRGLTYDQYTGRGWYTGGTETFEYRAGDLAIFRDRFEPPGMAGQTVSPASPGRRKVRQEVRAVGDLGELLYAAGDLVTADQDYRLAWRSTDDVFGATIISTDRPVRTPEVSPIVYRADSLVPAVGEAQLRAAGGDYPAWVRNRYLALPDKVPVRVLALARDLTATAPTPYDRARAIETYLRAFPYNLDLPYPPRDRDMVDYFLFDLRQGYCDYYATTMVVLARAAGLPARLAVGYFSGTYDEANARYVVTEADAHAWVEIYFPDYGWIEFEPTAGRPPIERPADALPPVVPPELETLGPITTARESGWSWWWLGLPGGLVLLGLGVGVWSVADNWRLRRLPPTAAVALLYQRLYRHGGRLGVPREAGDTAYEFAASFVGRVASLARERRWGTALTPAVHEARLLVDLYVRMQYSPHAPDAADRAQAMQTWRRLRRRLWLAWVWQKGSSSSGL
jgi:transglutaminase-like putative cysteine protease